MSDCVMFVCFTFGSKIFACSQKYLVNFGVKVVASCYWRQVGQVGGGNQRTTPPAAADQRQLLGTGQVAKSRQVAGNVADWDPSSGLQTPGDQRR